MAEIVKIEDVKKGEFVRLTYGKGLIHGTKTYTKKVTTEARKNTNSQIGTI